MILLTFRTLSFLGMLTVAMTSKMQAQEDLTAPEISRHALSPFVSNDAANGTSTRVSLYFSEPLEEGSALDTTHYSFPGATVARATLKLAGRKVVLELTPAPASESSYALTVHDITDLAGNMMVAVTLTGTTPRYELDLAISGTATQSSTPLDIEGNEYATADLANDGDIDGAVSVLSIASGRSCDYFHGRCPGLETL